MRAYGWLSLCLLLGACDAAPEAQPASLTREQLLDPAQCKSCHPQHYREWASSMHAYASDDPVFVAMNRRGQRETHGALGDFCVRCHAPQAVREGATRNGLDVEALPSSLRGVTCYFCHSAIATGPGFNNHVELADDLVMRGGIADPLPSSAHGAAYSPLHDRNQADSSALCGSCHDVVTPNGVHVERTYLEYQESLFGQSGEGFDTCSGCHMPGTPGSAAVGGGARTVHEHLWPGVDTALSPFPDRDAQRLAVECALGLNTRIYSVSLSPLGELTIKVETSAGHHQPSGAGHDRRLWLEVIAYDEANQVLFESGTIDDGELEEKPAGSPGYDAQLALFRDWLYDARGEPTSMMWNAASSQLYSGGFAALTLPATLQLGVAHTLDARYRLLDAARVHHIRMRLRMRAVGLDVLRDLVASGDLSESVIAEQPTFTLFGTAVEWRASDGTMTPIAEGRPRCPDAYQCLLTDDPTQCGLARPGP
jgi:hypothetical protein